MNYINKVCSFTGYRTKKLNFCISKSALDYESVEDCLRGEIVRMLDEDFNTFMCGMAIGADMMFAKTVLELKKKYPPPLINFVAVIPCLDHDKRWNESDRESGRIITAAADEVVYVSEFRYYNGCMAKRNRYLVDNCDELISIFDGQTGGTMQTINYAKGNGKKVTIIDPPRELIITLKESCESHRPLFGNI